MANNTYSFQASDYSCCQVSPPIFLAYFSSLGAVIFTRTQMAHLIALQIVILFHINSTPPLIFFLSSVNSKILLPPFHSFIHSQYAKRKTCPCVRFLDLSKSYNLVTSSILPPNLPLKPIRDSWRSHCQLFPPYNGYHCIERVPMQMNV